MDILAAAFFIVAGAWLFVAVLYSSLVLIFLRLRSRGELGSIYSEEFGRVYLWRRGQGCYIPLGWIFRRYIAHLQYEPGGSENNTPTTTVHFMTRDERRTAMETLLVKKKRKSCKKKYDQNPKQISKSQTTETEVSSSPTGDADIEQGRSSAPSCSEGDDGHECAGFEEDNEDLQQCSICLGGYDNDDEILRVQTCSHEFHEECILTWLQREANTECPCCRVDMVTEEQVWTCVRKNRKQKRREMRRIRKQQEQEVNESTTENSEDDETEQQLQATTGLHVLEEDAPHRSLSSSNTHSESATSATTNVRVPLGDASDQV